MVDRLRSVAAWRAAERVSVRPRLFPVGGCRTVLLSVHRAPVLADHGSLV